MKFKLLALSRWLLALGPHFWLFVLAILLVWAGVREFSGRAPANFLCGLLILWDVTRPRTAQIRR